MNNNPKRFSKLIVCSLASALLIASAQSIQAQDEMVQTVTTRPKKMIEKTVEKPQKPLLREEKQVSDKVIKLTGEVSITKSNEIITLSLRDSDTRQVLRMLADKAGLNIIFHDSVNGKITLDLVNTPLNKAFEYIMTVNSLQYWVDDDTLVVASLDGAGQIGLNRQEIQALKVKYLNASAVANFLNGSVFGLQKPGISNEQTAVINPRTNEVLIFGTKKDIELAKKVIAQIDVEPEMKTFELDHITPEKMATLLCDSIFNFNGEEASSAGSEDEEEDDEEDSSSEEESGMKPNEFGGGKIACQVFVSASGSSDTGAGQAGAQGEETAPTSGVDIGGSSNSLSSVEGSNISVVYYPELGKVTILGATVEQNQLADNLVKISDIKQPQAYIEMSIIELNEQGSRALSSTWGYYNGQFGLDLGADQTSSGSAWDGRGGSPIDIPIELEVLNLDGESEKIEARIPGGNYLAGDNYHGIGAFRDIVSPNYAKTLINNLSFVVSHQMGRVLTNPRIIATNNQTSTISLSSDYIKKIVTTTQSGTGIIENTKNYEIGEDNGINIELTPTISPKGYVVLSIKPNYKTIKSQIMNGTELAVTLLQSRSIELKNIRVKDGHTLVIGGLIQEIETKSEAKVPILGDLPLIGAAFRSTTKAKEKSELVILITPKILKEAEELDTI